MSKMLVNVKFPAQMGFRSGKEYAYVWDGSTPAIGSTAVVKSNDGSFALVRVVSVESYRPMPYAMKYLVQLVDDTQYNNRLTDFE